MDLMKPSKIETSKIKTCEVKLSDIHEGIKDFKAERPEHGHLDASKTPILRANCLDELKQEYRVYIESFIDRVPSNNTIKYSLFSVIIFLTSLLQYIFLSDIGKQSFSEWYFDNLGLLWSASFFFMFIMIIRLRNICVDVFLNGDVPYPVLMKERMRDYLYAIISPSKFGTSEAPAWFRKHPYIFNHFYMSLTISSLFAIIGGVIAYDDTMKKSLAGLNTSYDVLITTIFNIINIMIMWMLVITLAYMILGAILILRDISNWVNEEDKASSTDLFDRLHKYRHLQMNLLYSYSVMMIGIPNYVLTSFKGYEYNLWIYPGLFIVICAPTGFIITLLSTTYYQNNILNRTKQTYLNQVKLRIKELENCIFDTSSEEEHAEKCNMYVSLLHINESMESIRILPFDFWNVVKILIASITSLTPLIMRFI